MTNISDAMTAKTWQKLTPAPSLREILRRVLFPFALFGVVLLSLLVLSWYLLLPRFTRVDLHGTSRELSHLQTYVQDIGEQSQKLEDRRLALILPLDGSPYGRLVQAKMSQPSLLMFYEKLQNVAQTFLPEQSQSVVLKVIRWEHDVIELTGDVRNVGLQSMAVLAQFVEAVRAMPDVERVDFPSFTRERDGNIGFHSPFTIRIYLS
ncbi:hypothetical protein AUJ46_00595 [Candidatus Peregrinibacteria bacterium CG1_02_54_53]|nr:MAG: hypothetical protein AUJ46_00595 [Candidatus Peregrinibacteria bacterium CG1_02_54_53]